MNKKGNPEVMRKYQKRFSSDYQPKKNGRLPSTLRGMLAHFREKFGEPFTKGDLTRAAIYAMSLDESSARAIAGDIDNPDPKNKYPLVLRVMCAALLDKRMQLELIRYFGDRLFFKESVAVAVQNNASQLLVLTPEQVTNIMQVLSSSNSNANEDKNGLDNFDEFELIQ